MSPRGGFDEDLLMKVLSDFAHTLAGRFDVSEVLYRLCEHVIAILHVDGAGVSLLDDRGRLRPATAVNELSRRLEAAEEEHQQGPCVEVSRLGIEVVVPDCRAPARWDHLGASRMGPARRL